MLPSGLGGCGNGGRPADDREHQQQGTDPFEGRVGADAERKATADPRRPVLTGVPDR